MSTPISDGPPELPPLDPLIQKAMAGLPSDFANLPRLFQDEIRPKLQSRERDRQVAAKKSKQMTMVAVAVGLIGGIGGFDHLRF